MIREFNIYSPAEIMLLGNPDTKYSKLVRVTFLDLILRQILEVKPDKSDAEHLIVSVGKNFKGYQALAHEGVLLNPFMIDRDLAIGLPSYLKTAFQSVSLQKFKNRYVGHRLEKYYKGNWLQNVFGLKSLTEEGRKTRALIRQELDRLNQHVKDRDAAIEESLLKMRGNILLLNDVPASVFDRLNNRRNTENVEASDDYDTFFWYDYANIYFFMTASEVFDLDGDIIGEEFADSFDALDSSGDSSGDGGDGGCSGGCGDCGGCGG